MVQELLVSGTMIDGIDEANNTTLHIASESGHLALIKFLLGKGAAVNAAGSERWSPLHFASNNGHLDVVKYLLGNGAAVDTRTNFGETPLILASKKGHMSVVKCLIDNGAAVDAKKISGSTPLHTASENGHMDIVKYLHDNGAAVDMNDEYGHTPLQLAATGSHPNLDVVKYLLDNGASIDTSGNLCWMLLLAACEKGRLDIVKHLFDKGAAVDTKSGYFGTPMESAAKNGHLNIVMYLIDKGVSVERLPTMSENPLNCAYKNGHLDVFYYLLDKGAKVDQSDDSGQTLLHLASMYGDLDAAKSLLEKGAKVDPRDHVGQRPLHLASVNGHEYVVKYLIDKGAAIDSRDNYGWTSLHYACNFGNKQVVLALLDAGVDTTLTTKEGETVQDLSSDGKLLALLDKLDWIRKCFGGDMVPNLAKNPKTVSFLADSALYATMRSIQQNPYKFIKHQNDARVLTTFNELSKLTNPHPVHTSSSYYDQLTIKDSSSTSGVYSTQSAIEHIQHTLQNIKNMDSGLLHTAKTILSLVLEFQTNRERLLATGVMVGRIVNRMTWRGAPMQDSNLLQIFEDVRIYLQSKLQTTQAWKLLLYNNHRQATIQAIDTKIIRFQDRLCQAANYLNLDLKLQVVGNVNDCAIGFARMIDTINGLDKYLELISNVPSLREQTDKLQELIIQMKRGFEHYSRQVEVGNIARNVEFESQVKKCQNQIEDTVKDMDQRNKSRYCIEKIESWMLSSDDIDFDPNNVNSALGRGGFATVFRGMYHGQQVAVKRFDQIVLADSPDLEKLIVKEVKAWKDISHEPYILTLIGVCTKIPTPILVCELCQTNIRRYVRNWPDTLIPMVYQFACGLVSLHNAWIIHRDLKGDNVLITFQDTVAIADFGLSRAIMTFDESKTGNERSGTLNWMSPEQYLTPNLVTRKSDVWSFGMTVWEVLCNDIPYKDYGRYEIPEALVSDDERPNKPKHLSPHLESLWTLITMCWQVDPADRPSAIDIIKYLKKHYGSELGL